MTIGSGLGGFTAGASQLSAAGTSTASDSGNDMMGQIEQTAAMQMKFQTEMGIPPDPSYIGCHEITHFVHEVPKSRPITAVIRPGRL